MNQKKAKKTRKEKGPERDWTQERDLRCIPIVHEIFKTIANLEKMPINHDFMTKEEAYKIYFDINKAVNTEISLKGVDVKSDLEFIFQCVNEIVTITQKLVIDSVAKNESILKDAIYDVKDGEPDLYTTTKLIKMIEKKEEIREAIKKIIE
jgi:hypothetical protein